MLAKVWDGLRFSCFVVAGMGGMILGIIVGAAQGLLALFMMILPFIIMLAASLVIAQFIRSFFN